MATGGASEGEGPAAQERTEGPLVHDGWSGEVCKEPGGPSPCRITVKRVVIDGSVCHLVPSHPGGGLRTLPTPTPPEKGPSPDYQEGSSWREQKGPLLSTRPLGRADPGGSRLWGAARGQDWGSVTWPEGEKACERSKVQPEAGVLGRSRHPLTWDPAAHHASRRVSTPEAARSPPPGTHEAPRRHRPMVGPPRCPLLGSPQL